MTKFHSCGNSHSVFPSASVFDGIVLGREEVYDATRLPIWRFCKSTDVRDGLVLDLGNMCGGYPFSLYGHRFYTSESAYLCGEFSQGVREAGAVQRQLLMERCGMNAKKKIKAPHAHLIRPDWQECMLDWMLLVVWNKCKGNGAFAGKLMAIPEDAVIVEDSTFQTGKTCTVWGAKNKKLRESYQALKKQLQQCGWNKTAAKEEASRQMVTFDQGIYEGQNNMGKILKMCQLALLHGLEPPINYANLRAHNIHLFGRLLTFEAA